MSHYKSKLFIDGQWVDSILGETFTTVNPATNQPICEVANGTVEDIALAVKAARRCLESPNWGYKSTGSQRAIVLRKLGEIIASRKGELSRLDSLDQGKPLREAEADIGDAISACEHFAKLAEDQDSKQNEVIENGTEGQFVSTIVLEPIGVIGAITPWNYPFLMGIWKVVPAIAAGCTMVLKPSELAPLSCLLLGEMCLEAGLPAGALNVVPGLGSTAGAAISNHPDIDKISFTGSVTTAQKIMMAASMGPRAISLELGGKSPLLVFEDADVNSTVDWMLTGILWGSGQVCSATSRVLLHKNIREAVLARLAERLVEVKMGDSLSEEMLTHGSNAAMGPVVSKGQYDKIWTYIHNAQAAGYSLFYGGDAKKSAATISSSANNDSARLAALGEGYFIPPTIFLDVPVDSVLWREEIFGPVLCIREFTTEEEAVTVANDSEYGLAAAVFSADSTRCDRVSRALRAGIVWSNCCQPAFIQCPWGGCKKSGFGRELGRWGLEEFTAVKQVTTCASGVTWGLW